MPNTDAPATDLPARHPLAQRFLPRSVHYGWWITLGASVLTFVGVGVGYYGLAVFLRPLQDEHGWSNAVVSGATGLYFSVSGLTTAVVGPIVDRRGPLRLMAGGAVLMGIAVTAVGFVDTVWQLYGVYLLLAISFGCTVGTGTQSIISRWFVSRRAQAMSISFTGVSVGGMVLVPLGTALIDRGGLELAGPVMGILVVVVALPVVATVLVWDPSQMGAEVDFGKPLAVDNANLSQSVQQRSWTRGEAAGTLSFWAVLVAFVLVLAAQTGFLIHQLSFLEDRLGSRQTASFTLTVTAFGSVVARLVVGQVADRISKRDLSVVLFLVQAAAVVGVVLINNTITTWVFVLIIGFTIGNVYMMQTLLVSELYGMVSFATVMGIIGLATQTGSGIGPFVVGWLEHSTGSYRTPFLVTAAVTTVAAIIVAGARPVRPDPPD
ncbi:MAG: MFS transporter [Actinomycetia bacterium]|nr:MFS transporter [Actinomycetes bacterium]